MRILFVSYNAPPTRSARSTRLASLGRWLMRRGHTLQIFTVDRGGDDAFMLGRLEGAEFVRVPAGPLERGSWGWRASGATRQAGRSARARVKDALQHLVVPERQIEWAVHLLRNQPLAAADVVVSFVPPFSGAVVGHVLARRMGAAHVIDYGDPWSLKINQRLPRWRVAVDRRLERHLVSRAAGVVFNAPPTLEAMRASFPEQPRMACLLSGYDPDEYDPTPAPPGKELRHLGNLYDIRLPLDPLARAVEGHPAFERIAQYGQRHYVGLPDAFEERAPVPYQEALRLMQSAGALLLVGNRGALQIPSKLYGYLGAGRPILAVVESGDDPVARMGLGDQVVVTPCEESAIRQALDRLAERMDRSFEPPAQLRWEEIAAAYEARLEEWVTGRPSAP